MRETLTATIVVLLACVTAYGQVEDRGPFAKVQVLSGGEFVPLVANVSTNTGGRTIWSKIPPEFEGSYFLKDSPREGRLEFRVIEPGVVIMACTTRWGGGGSGGAWQKEITTRNDLLADKWKEVGQLHSLHQTTPISWAVFAKSFKKGMSFSIRTEKYQPPILILKMDQEAHRDGEPLEHAEGVVGKLMPEKNSEPVPSEAGTQRDETGRFSVKAPIPDAESQQAVKKAAAEIYGERFRKAATDADMIALAKEMIQAAMNVRDGSVDQYVLLSIAVDVAAGAGDAKTALEAVEPLAERFDVAGAKLKAESLVTAARHASTSTQHKMIAEAASGVIDELGVADDYETALSLCEMAQSAARKGRQYTLIREFATRAGCLKKRAALAKEYNEAMATLEKDPTEATANLAAGRYLCFVKGDWARGLAMLALGSDPDLKDAAVKDLKGGETAEAQAALGDAWWALAESNEGQERESLKCRAGTWYRQAVPNVTGIGRLLVKKRLEEVAKLGREIPEPSGVPPSACAPFDQKKAKDLQIGWAKHLGLPVEREIDLPGGVKLTLVLIPPGELLMGSPEAERQRALEEAKAANDKWAIEMIPTEAPPHRVKITRPFYLGKYEVTQAQWQAVMGSNPSEFKDQSNPVENVSWDDIQPFLAKLNVSGTRRVPPASTGRTSTEMKYALPTEAQREYACRAGTTTAFCFGDNAAMLGQYAWFNGNAGGKTHPVGGLKPNAWGLHDMHGNVWEWCGDWWAGDYYAQSPPSDPPGPMAGSHRVIRGGSWNYNSWDCRSADRFRQTPGRRGYSIGFRLALVSVDE